jgi:hypothetical protein
MSLIGCIDILADTCISGWAADDADREQPVQVDVIVNSLLVATVPCENFREDLLAAGIGDGRKAFRFDPSAHLKPGRNQLEVRYAGTDLIVSKGRGHWVRRRDGRISEREAELLAALETYYEFEPDVHVCGIGDGASDLQRVLLAAGVPFLRFTRLEMPLDPAVMRLAEKADVAVCWARPKPAVESVRFMLDNTNTSGLMALGFTDTPEAPREIRQVFAACGIPAVRFESMAAMPGQSRLFAFADSHCAEATQAVPVLAHIHVPKCAGTSVRVLLERHFGPRHLPLYVNDTYFVYGSEALRSYILQNPEIRGFSSHHVRTFPHWLAGREILYVTFLRDPIQQFVSYMTHVKKLYSGITSKSLLEAVPPAAPQLTLREFARWLLTQDRDIPFRENHNVNFFTRHSSAASLDRLEAAKAVLDRFFFVGITERMEESINKLRALAQAAGLDFPPDPAPLENTSSDYRDDLSWIHPGDEVGSLLLRSVEQDRQLYDWAVARFNE